MPRTNRPRTKIVCTLGPASDAPGVLDAMIEAGMSVARINFSHGGHPDHARRIEQVREAAARAGATVAVLADLQGPKFRIGDVAGGQTRIEAGSGFVLTTRPVAGNAQGATLPHPDLVAALQPGERLLLDDGLLELRVESKTETDLVCRVRVGGVLGSRKGVSVPDTTLAMPSLTDKDCEDVGFAVRRGVDMLALSFVRSASDVQTLRELLSSLQARVQVVAKIEKRQALDSFTEILAASDAIMVARGDLGVETPAEEVPIHQKEIIRECNQAGTPVITATQMLQSMVESPTPTRAEASDVANAILDGSDAVMLSAETAVGKHPVETVRMMERIAQRTEPHLHSRLAMTRNQAIDPSDAVAHAAVDTASDLEAAAIVTVTLTGYTARRISKYRPPTPVLAVTPDPQVQQRLALVWGVLPWAMPRARSTDEMLQLALAAVRECGIARAGDSIVLTGSVPFDAGLRTNFLKVHVVE